jgi:hypothetical protein
MPSTSSGGEVEWKDAQDLFHISESKNQAGVALLDSLDDLVRSSLAARRIGEVGYRE